MTKRILVTLALLLALAIYSRLWAVDGFGNGTIPPTPTDIPDSTPVAEPTMPTALPTEEQPVRMLTYLPITQKSRDGE